MAATEIDSTVRVPPASVATSAEKATLAVMLPTYRLIESTPAADPLRTSSTESRAAVMTFGMALPSPTP